MLRPTALLRLAPLCLLLLAACERNECRPGAHECDGNVARNCQQGGDHYVLNEWTCDGRCVDAEEEAICAVSDASLDAACADVDDYASTCSGNTTLSCHAGYAVSEYSCWDTQVCVADSGYASCQLPKPEPEPEPCTDCEQPEPEPEPEPAPCNNCQSEPDPRCPEPEGSFCDGATHVFCHAGFVTTSEDCGAPDLCIVTSDTSFCALSATEDALCASRSDGTKPTVYCDQNATVLCYEGYRLSQLACESGQTCIEYTDIQGASCQTP